MRASSHVPGGTRQTRRAAEVAFPNLASGAATGFCFEKYSAAELLATIKRALACYADRKTWLKLMKNGMSQNWSWDESARKYVQLYTLVRQRAQAAK